MLPIRFEKAISGIDGISNGDMALLIKEAKEKGLSVDELRHRGTAQNDLEKIVADFFAGR